MTEAHRELSRLPHLAKAILIPSVGVVSFRIPMGIPHPIDLSVPPSSVVFI
jgi:hypothetical protein